MLIPVGGTGPPNSYSQTPAGKIRGEPDVAAIRDSDLYGRLGELRSMLQAREVLSARRDDNTILEIRADYTYAEQGVQHHVEIARWRPALPVAAGLPVGVVLFGSGLIGSAHAVWYDTQSNPPVGNQLWFIEAGILTQMEGNSSVSQLKQLARILVQ